MRLRDLGIQIGTLPTGPSNTLTDVPGVRVGHQTLIRGQDVRTGATAIWPHDGNPLSGRVYAGIHALNGFGEMTCRSVIDECGLLSTPIVLTGTSGVGMALHATTRYLAQRYPEQVRNEIPIPVVAECDDGFLHDHLTFALMEQDVWAALDGATTNPVVEGCVGAGTGMQLFQFKGGIGSSSRVVDTPAGTYTVGVLVETNFGLRPRLTVAGVRVGPLLTDLLPEEAPDPSPQNDGSCIVIVGTDAPLHAHTLRRMAQRAGLGLARTGSAAGDGSGEIFLAFSNAQHIPYHIPEGRFQISVFPEGIYGNTGLNALFGAVVDAAEEAVLNALLMATTTTGRQGNVVHAAPHDRLVALLQQARLV
ncbi:MAG TPA: P1 family peptidase [Ktedonobacterales bacterium]|jgi:D-aminopeptidase